MLPIPTGLQFAQLDPGFLRASPYLHSVYAELTLHRGLCTCSFLVKGNCSSLLQVAHYFFFLVKPARANDFIFKTSENESF